MSLKLAAKQIHDAITAASYDLAKAETAVIHFTNERNKAQSAWDALKPLLSADELKFDPAAPAKVKSGAKPSHKAHTANPNVPATDAAFWLSLITKEEQKTPAIIAAAAKALNVTDPAAIEVLKPRMAAFLKTAVETKKIEAKGERFDRVYFLPA